MQTTQELILAELARWQQCRKDVEALLDTDELTIVNHGRLQREIDQQIAKCQEALRTWPDAN
jgi:hypothetical protein